MGKNKGPGPPNFQKYGVPFYSAAWVPYKSIKFDQEEDREQSTDEVSGGQKSSPAPESSAAQDYVVFAGGGGGGRSGIPNAVVLSRFNFASNALSDQPVRISYSDLNDLVTESFFSFLFFCVNCKWSKIGAFVEFWITASVLCVSIFGIKLCVIPWMPHVKLHFFFTVSLVLNKRFHKINECYSLCNCRNGANAVIHFMFRISLYSWKRRTEL